MLPQKCGEQVGEGGGPRIVMRVFCPLEGESGWDDWAPLASLCRAVRLTIAPPPLLVKPWLRTKYAVIARSPRGPESPVEVLHIIARWWEPESCWSLGEGAGPRPRASLSPHTSTHASPKGGVCRHQSMFHTMRCCGHVCFATVELVLRLLTPACVRALHWSCRHNATCKICGIAILLEALSLSS